VTLSERIKSNCPISRESCPNLDLLRKGLGYSYRRGTLSELESERELTWDSTRAGAETIGCAK
jgi:hypothetical protein